MPIKIPDGYELITNPNHRITRLDRYTRGDSPQWLLTSLSLGDTLAECQRKWPSKIYIKPIKITVGSMSRADKIIAKAISDANKEIANKESQKNKMKEIPSGYALIPDNEAIPYDGVLYWRVHWLHSHEWRKIESGFNSARGKTPIAANAMVSTTGDIFCYFIKPVPRFKTDKPYPYGY